MGAAQSTKGRSTIITMRTLILSLFILGMFSTVDMQQYPSFTNKGLEVYLNQGEPSGNQQPSSGNANPYPGYGHAYGNIALNPCPRQCIWRENERFPDGKCVTRFGGFTIGC